MSLSLLVITFLIAVNAVVSQEKRLITNFVTPCVTPNHDEGLCMELADCFVLRGKNETNDFIRESRCDTGDALQELRVCCGKYTDYLHKLNSKKTLAKRLKKVDKSLFPETCGNQTVEVLSRIFGGKVAKLGEFPWMARLRFRDDNDVLTYGCTGFLISEKFVLTAAHCFRFAHLGNLHQVQLGEYNTQEQLDCQDISRFESRCADPPQLLRTEEPIIHPEFSNNTEQHNDIAVIPLKDPAKFSKYVYPICLTEKYTEETEMWLSGWGKTETADESPLKLKVSIQRADWENCADIYSTEGIQILDSQICAGDTSGGDSCTGDSGGPLMVQRGSESWYAEGIVSFGMGCGFEEWPGIYTSIPYYLPWIKKVVNNHLNKVDL